MTAALTLLVALVLIAGILVGAAWLVLRRAGWELEQSDREDGRG